MINLRINIKNIENEAVFIELAGEMDVYTTRKFKKTLNELIKKRNYKLIIDLNKVTYIDSVGVGSLLGGLKRTRDQKGDLWLVYSRKSGVWKFFNITNLDNNFSIYKTQNEARKALDRAKNKNKKI